jgi:hypothetical protein
MQLVSSLTRLTADLLLSLSKVGATGSKLAMPQLVSDDKKSMRITRGIARLIHLHAASSEYLLYDYTQ